MIQSQINNAHYDSSNHLGLNSPLTNAILTQLNKTSTQLCNIPAKTVIFNALNGGSFDLFLEQRKGLALDKDLNCLKNNVVTLCLDSSCMQLCQKHAIPRCIHYINTSSNANVPYNLQTSTFREPTWNLITYLKWELIDYALTLGATYVLTVDVDILLLRNPFTAANQQVGHYELLHQAEYADTKCEDTKINSGFMLIKNTEKTRTMAQRMLKSKQRNSRTNGFDKQLPLEQEVLLKVVSKLGVTKCHFDYHYFTGHCQFAHRDEVFVKDIVSYHAHCTKEFSTKLALMSHFITAVQLATSTSASATNKKITFNEAEIQRNYFDQSLYANDPDKPIKNIFNR